MTWDYLSNLDVLRLESRRAILPSKWKMAADGSCERSRHLDRDGCISLSAILGSFNAPISEEQAWAVCFQTSRCLKKIWEEKVPCFCLTNTAQIFIQRDGQVSRKTATYTSGFTRPPATTEYKLVTSLGITLFHALDFGLCEEEERSLSPSLELLIDRMTSADPDDDSHADDSSSSDDETASQNIDEGIEKDSEEDDMLLSETGHEKAGLTLEKVLEMCMARLSNPHQADNHYKAVCRALVAEVQELSTFLEKVSQGTKELLKNSQEESNGANLDCLQVQDWARLWMQVIRELRQGVKLKKVDSAPHPIEYELTPYEMLLDDIRARRYKLNKVMVNGDIPPRVKKDAHALILEFIRSRPPLVPVSKRKLRPLPPRQPTLYEKLMASLKQQHKLKPVPRETQMAMNEDEVEKPQQNRRLIKVDLSLRLSSSFEDDDFDDLFNSPPSEESHPTPNDVDAYETNNYFEERRHSVPVYKSPVNQCDIIRPPLLKAKTLDYRYIQDDTISSPVASDFWKSSQWQSLECLSLTLEEVVHIRNVLTKADLETLLVFPQLYNDVANGKVCFTCKKTKFSFFGSWGVKCKLCERIVCSRCYSKMHIPTEHFSSIPVYMLSPTPPTEDPDNFWKFSFDFIRSQESQSPEEPPEDLPAPTKVQHSESFHSLSNIEETEDISPPKKKGPLLRSKTIHHQPEDSFEENSTKGPVENVCCDCKEMLCHIIAASQATKSIRNTYRNKWKRQKSLPTAKSFASTLSKSVADEFGGSA
ncbi:protein spire homolog 1-like isoform X2 [Centruroides vittatus]|uniref:protein spire homolog 1-like isoform X2 n=1 Tax=Centruroides vittatus TaxID=120091 RepID=UPI00350F296D